jgi:tagatose-1,6-bisphosphate aldolase
MIMGLLQPVALDQRGLLKGMIAKELGTAPSDQMVMEFKGLVASTLVMWSVTGSHEPEGSETACATQAFAYR